MELTEALQKFYGFSTFRQGQQEIITQLLAQKNVLGVLPTGSGKTLCYSFPSFLRPGLTVILSPLISLMEDQVQRLNRLKKSSATSLHSHQTPEERRAVLKNLKRFSFLLLSPEMLQNPQVQEALQRVFLALVVIDEAHCVSQWGFDFRPEYLQIAPTLEKLGAPQVLALTATAPREVLADIKKFLFLKESPVTFTYPVDRPNIGYLVKMCQDEKERLADLLNFLKKQTVSGIIYCNTRKKCQELTAMLKENHLSASYYHGGLTPLERKKLQAQFQAGDISLMVATNAFGMGIDKSDIRFVIHYQLPASLEDYVQETGRCGRDGLPSVALLYYVTNDERIHGYFAKERWANLPQIAEQLQSLEEKQGQTLNFLQEKSQLKNQQQKELLAYIFSNQCLRQQIAAYFHDPTPNIPEKCCSYHGLQEETYEEIFTQIKPVVPKKIKRTWEEKLEQLFHS